MFKNGLGFALAGVMASSVAMASTEIELRQNFADSMDTQSIEATVGLSDRLYLIGEAENFDSDALALAVGLGHSYALGDAAEVAAELRYLYLDVDGLDSEDGWAITGLYSRAINGVEGLTFDGELSLSEFAGESDWGYEAALGYQLAPQLEASAAISGNDDATDFEVGISYSLSDALALAAEHTFGDEEDVTSVGINLAF